MQGRIGPILSRTQLPCPLPEEGLGLAAAAEEGGDGGHAGTTGGHPTPGNASLAAGRLFAGKVQVFVPRCPFWCCRQKGGGARQEGWLPSRKSQGNGEFEALVSDGGGLVPDVESSSCQPSAEHPCVQTMLRDHGKLHLSAGHTWAAEEHSGRDHRMLQSLWSGEQQGEGEQGTAHGD